MAQMIDNGLKGAFKLQCTVYNLPPVNNKPLSAIMF